jgi:large subunit ribosomal protein L21
MYAVIKTGGKQYRVKEGEYFNVEKIDTAIGEKITFDKILMIGDGDNVQVGTPILEKATVEATITNQGKAKKVIIIKFRRRKHSMTRQGHRQLFTTIEINKIKAGAVTKKAASKKETVKKETNKTADKE